MTKSISLSIIIAGALIAGAIVYTHLDRPKTVMETINNEAAKFQAKVDAEMKCARALINGTAAPKNC